MITVPIFRTRRENVALRQKIADLQVELREERLDPITALPTRAYWTRLAEWQFPRTAAVVLIDLDGFKQLNDTHSHAAGDHMLAWTAHRLRTLCGDHAVISRLGGDEFALATTRHLDRDDLDTIVTGLTAPVDLAGTQIHVGISLGIAYTADLPGEIRDLPSALGAADLAMYAAKARNGGAFIYNRRMLGTPLIVAHPVHRTRYSDVA